MRQAMTEDVLTLARQVSRRFYDATGECDTNATPEKHHATGLATPALQQVSGIDIDDLHREAGEVDWAANKDAPHWVETFARSVSEGRLLRAGVVPDTYTAKTVCKSCGEVPVPPGWGSTVNNCRWCFVGGYQK